MAMVVFDACFRVYSALDGILRYAQNDALFLSFREITKLGAVNLLAAFSMWLSDAALR